MLKNIIVKQIKTVQKVEENDFVIFSPEIEQKLAKIGFLRDEDSEFYYYEGLSKTGLRIRAYGDNTIVIRCDFDYWFDPSEKEQKGLLETLDTRYDEVRKIYEQLANLFEI